MVSTSVHSDGLCSTTRTVWVQYSMLVQAKLIARTSPMLFPVQTDGVSPPRAGYQRVGPPRTPGVAAALAAEVSNLPDPSTPLSAAAASVSGRQPFYKPPFPAAAAARLL